jgi:hypothetical protein
MKSFMGVFFFSVIGCQLIVIWISGKSLLRWPEIRESPLEGGNEPAFAYVLSTLLCPKYLVVFFSTGLGLKFYLCAQQQTPCLPPRKSVNQFNLPFRQFLRIHLLIRKSMLSLIQLMSILMGVIRDKW